MKILAILTLGSTFLGANLYAGNPDLGSAYLTDNDSSLRTSNAAIVRFLAQTPHSSNTSMHSLTFKSERLKEQTSNSVFSSVMADPARNSLTGGVHLLDRAVPQSAFADLKASSIGSSGGARADGQLKSLRLSIDFGSSKNQMSAVSVPTRHTPTSSQDSIRPGKASINIDQKLSH